MDEKTKRKFGVYVFLGLLIGALLGTGMGASSANQAAWTAGGALAGLAIAWFIAAAVIERDKNKQARE